MIKLTGGYAESPATSLLRLYAPTQNSGERMYPSSVRDIAADVGECLNPEQGAVSSCTALLLALGWEKQKQNFPDSLMGFYPVELIAGVYDSTQVML